MSKALLRIAILVVMCSGSALAAQTARKPTEGPTKEAPPGLSQQWLGFQRNLSLGGTLTARTATPQELNELHQLADGGLAAARKAVAQKPTSAEAHYLLGSCLLYGYRVVGTTQTVEDADGVARTETVRRVVQGLTDDYGEGLEALKRATVLDPGRGRYLVDYAAALYDCDRGPEAEGVLKAAWAAPAGLTKAEKMEAAILLSSISFDEWRFREAREWAYSALSVAPENSAGLQRLRQLDAAQAAAAPEAGAAEAAATLAPEAAGEQSADETEASGQGEEEAPAQENVEE